MPYIAPAPGGSKGRSNDASRRTNVYLNVYDLTPVNKYLYWFGLGIFHTGIEVHGVEYAFGAHEYPTSGVFEVEPKSCPGFVFRRSVWLGSTDMSRSEFKLFIEHLSGTYHGDSYHLIAKNCNHFTDDVCMHLTGKPIPGWVNRLARFGSFCNCLLPESIQATTVRHLPDHDPVSDVDGSESDASFGIIDSDEESDHHLLRTPNSEVSFVREKPVVLARDLIRFDISSQKQVIVPDAQHVHEASSPPIKWAPNVETHSRYYSILDVGGRDDQCDCHQRDGRDVGVSLTQFKYSMAKCAMTMMNACSGIFEYRKSLSLGVST